MYFSAYSTTYDIHYQSSFALHNVLLISVHNFHIFCITINIAKEVEQVGFQIKEKRETENKTIRFPLTVIEQINEAIKGTNTSFSSFVIQACQYALNNMDNKK